MEGFSLNACLAFLDCLPAWEAARVKLNYCCSDTFELGYVLRVPGQTGPLQISLEPSSPCIHQRRLQRAFLRFVVITLLHKDSLSVLGVRKLCFQLTANRS